ncbi:MAG TPA: bifunctional DNA-formamidopyrimidine glycosylase/DNA-(apurinic or apyrimidinic site) lyase [bacterium]|nr:bifunctional DNA-formamidopyrimidine glycosylase/DNA-(apurinic or apyrimidinic site) lyase [bacterium]
MAELPEVETMRADLEREVMGCRIGHVVVAQTRMLGGRAASELVERLTGQTIMGVRRRGKFLLLDLSSGDTLLLHRGMTGNLFLRDPHAPPDRHLHLVLALADGRELRLCDHRGFGAVRMLAPAEVAALDARLGPEPLGRDFTPAYLAGQLARRKTPVKALLLNQRVVAGLGNIYTDEALWAARIHPARRCHTLHPCEAAALHAAVVQVLTEAIAHRGTTFSDYRDLYGRPGGNAAFLRVFHRAGQPCPRCGEAIRLIRVAGRGSSICPRCQPDPANSRA